MAHVLILYATSEGQTARIAAEMVNTIRDLSVGATRKDLETWPGIYDLADFDAIIVGASVHFHQYPKEILAWIERHLDIIKSKPSAFYSVSMTGAQESEDGRERMDDYLTNLFEKTHWHPDLTASFAGAMRYSELDGVRQRVGQFVSWRTGGETDISQDTEYTDWDRVRAFSAEFVRLVKNTEVSDV
jgi:menaquinone-dependent protoporphyrinogen oxidase